MTRTKRLSTYGNCRTTTETYVCADGHCADSRFDCYAESSDCLEQLGDYRCPEGYCVTMEWLCMRPCGFAMSVQSFHGLESFTYNRRCPDYDGLCLEDSDYAPCPLLCPSHQELCGPQLCVNKGYCTTCYGSRCPDTGKCLSRSERCDRYNDCPNGWDEVDCPSADTTGVGGGSINDHSNAVIIGAIGGAAFLSLVIVICCAVIKFKRRSSPRQTRSSGLDTHSASRNQASTTSEPLIDRPWRVGPPTESFNIYTTEPTAPPPESEPIRARRPLPVIVEAHDTAPPTPEDDVLPSYEQVMYISPDVRGNDYVNLNV